MKWYEFDDGCGHEPHVAEGWYVCCVVSLVLCAVWYYLWYVCCVELICELCGIWYVSCVVSFGHKPLDITNGCHSCGPNPICRKYSKKSLHCCVFPPSRFSPVCFSSVFRSVFLGVFLGVLRSVFLQCASKCVFGVLLGVFRSVFLGVLLGVFLQCASRCVSRCAATKQMFWFLSSVLPLSRSVILTGAAEVGQNSATDREGERCRKIQQYCNMAGVSSSPNYNTNFTKLWTGWTDRFGFWLTKSEIWQRSDSSGWSNLIWNIRLMRVTKKERVGLVNRFGDSNKIHFEKNKEL